MAVNRLRERLRVVLFPLSVTVAALVLEAGKRWC